MQARSDLVRAATPDQLTLYDVPADAPYEGAGPVYVWTGEKWLDYNRWLATAAPVRGPAASDAAAPPIPTASQAKKKKNKKAGEGALFDYGVTDK